MRGRSGPAEGGNPDNLKGRKDEERACNLRPSGAGTVISATRLIRTFWG